MLFSWRTSLKRSLAVSSIDRAFWICFIASLSLLGFSFFHVPWKSSKCKADAFSVCILRLHVRQHNKEKFFTKSPVFVVISNRIHILFTAPFCQIHLLIWPDLWTSLMFRRSRESIFDLLSSMNFAVFLLKKVLYPCTIKQNGVVQTPRQFLTFTYSFPVIPNTQIHTHLL